ncbi:hypothetical protein IE077_003229 [Cardiosporidium cionae]|uniref:Origin recognition complex subunit 4 n=1 Tax=Cardiosporidium cionae TaxID=476202 RepID=A0ABQ7JF92_9APIC|nr:hypothetical protein IE077_003229 [Cardiosporidium cionae]|eukprot:KAF8822633.1 hypothetical protein IE077_003229 [Cardiosporidium cionae]
MSTPTPQSFPSAKIVLTRIIRSRLAACLDPFATHPLSAPIQACPNVTGDNANDLSSRKDKNSNTTALPFNEAVTALIRFLNDVRTAESVPPSLCFLGPPAAGKTKALFLALRSYIPTTDDPMISTVDSEISSIQPCALDVINEPRSLVVVYVPCNLFDLTAIDDAGLRFIVQHLRTYLKSKSLQTQDYSARSSVTALRSLLDVVKRNRKVALIVLDNFEVLCKPVSTFYPQQTLLYTLLDLQHRSLPVCTLAISSTLHVFDFLEKRIRSRFSFRRLFISSPIQYETISKCIQAFLSVNQAELTSKENLVLLAQDEVPLLKHFLDHYSTWVQSLLNDVNLQLSWKECLVHGKDFSWFCSHAFELFLQRIVLEDTLSLTILQDLLARGAIESNKNKKMMNTNSSLMADPPRTPSRRKSSDAMQEHRLEKEARASVSSRTRSNVRKFEDTCQSNEISVPPIESSVRSLDASPLFQYPSLSKELQTKKKLLTELGRTDHLVLCALYRLHRRKVMPKNLARIKEEIRLFNGQYQGKRASVNLSSVRRAYFRLLDMGIVMVSKNVPCNAASSEMMADTLEELTTCKFQDYSLYGSTLKELHVETQLEKWALQEVTFTT